MKSPASFKELVSWPLLMIRPNSVLQRNNKWRGSEEQTPAHLTALILKSSTKDNKGEYLPRQPCSLCRNSSRTCASRHLARAEVILLFHFFSLSLSFPNRLSLLFPLLLVRPVASLLYTKSDSLTTLTPCCSGDNFSFHTAVSPLKKAPRLLDFFLVVNLIKFWICYPETRWLLNSARLWLRT